jgi:hypothetical protein
VNGLIDGEADFLLRSRMLSLRTLTEYMAGMHGRRKSIIYVTTGVGASVYEALDYTGGIPQHRHRGPACSDHCGHSWQCVDLSA